MAATNVRSSRYQNCAAQSLNFDNRSCVREKRRETALRGGECAAAAVRRYERSLRRRLLKPWFVSGRLSVVPI